jgi:FixJ family two-component response regulator
MTRLDFASWLATLSNRDRQLAEKLVLGETTGRVARTFRISAARVSQLRRELCANWHQFVGELTDAGAPSLATA